MVFFLSLFVILLLHKYIPSRLNCWAFLRLAQSLPLENHSPRSNIYFFYSKERHWVCLWWWPTLHSWESSVEGPLRETWLHGFAPSCGTFVLNSRQICSCARSDTWWQLYYQVETGKDCIPVDTHFICSASRTGASFVPAVLKSSSTAVSYSLDG